MPFTVQIMPPVAKKLARWGLPDFLLVECYLRLREDLAQLPAQRLVRVRKPFDGLVYHFSCIDPDNRLCEHRCAFQVLYSQDETTIVVVNFAYQRLTGA